MEISPGTAGDVPELSRILARVFANDPIMRGFLVSKQDPIRTFERTFAIELETVFLPRGRVDVARDGDAIIGTALWTEPGAEVGRGGAVATIRMAAALGRSFPRARRLESAAHRARPGFPHWYLGYIAVAEAARGGGVGSALLDHGIERAGEDAVYLESTSAGSQALYERKGFIPLGVVRGSGSSAEVGMWRPGIVRRPDA